MEGDVRVPQCFGGIFPFLEELQGRQGSGPVGPANEGKREALGSSVCPVSSVLPGSGSEGSVFLAGQAPLALTKAFLSCFLLLKDCPETARQMLLEEGWPDASRVSVTQLLTVTGHLDLAPTSNPIPPAGKASPCVKGRGRAVWVLFTGALQGFISPSGSGNEALLTGGAAAGSVGPCGGTPAPGWAAEQHKGCPVCSLGFPQP